jgi:hypothetical protein
MADRANSIRITEAEHGQLAATEFYAIRNADSDFRDALLGLFGALDALFMGERLPRRWPPRRHGDEAKAYINIFAREWGLPRREHEALDGPLHVWRAWQVWDERRDGSAAGEEPERVGLHATGGNLTTPPFGLEVASLPPTLLDYDHSGGREAAVQARDAFWARAKAQLRRMTKDINERWPQAVAQEKTLRQKVEWYARRHHPLCPVDEDDLIIAAYHEACERLLRDLLIHEHPDQVAAIEAMGEVELARYVIDDVLPSVRRQYPGRALLIKLIEELQTPIQKADLATPRTTRRGRPGTGSRRLPSLASLRTSVRDGIRDIERRFNQG